MSELDQRFLASIAFVGLLIGIDLFFASWIPQSTEPVCERISHQIGDWSGQDVEMSEEMLAMLLGEGRTSYFERHYVNSNDTKISAIVIYIDRPEALRHTPERCLKGAGWALDRIGTIEVPLKGGKTTSANLVTAVKKEMRATQLYLYVTAEGYRRTPLSSLIDYSSNRLTSRDQTMAHVILTMMTPLEKNQLEILDVLAEFTGDYIPYISETLQDPPN